MYLIKQLMNLFCALEMFFWGEEETISLELKLKCLDLFISFKKLPSHLKILWLKPGLDPQVFIEFLL